MDQPLKGKVILATGSTHGIGKAAILRLAEYGADIIVNGRTEETGQQAVHEVEQRGSRATFIPADVEQYADVAALVERGIREMGHIDAAVVSGAGAVPPATPFRPFTEHRPEDFVRIAVQHWITKAYVAHALIPHFIERGGGKIVNVVSDAGRTATPGESMLGAGAAAAIQMSKVLARELGRYNIRINTVAVTITDTSQSDPPRGRPSGLESPMMSKISAKIAERRLFPVTGFDVGNAIVYLLGPWSDAVTGQTLSVNGGLSVPG